MQNKKLAKKFQYIDEDEDGDDDGGNDNLEPVVHVMGVSAWPGHADTMVTILNWKVGLRW